MGGLTLTLADQAIRERTRDVYLLSRNEALTEAIADGHSWRQNIILKEKSDAQFHHIARDLHDNLAQNLIVVRHKLDELTGEDTLQEITNIRQDLERMREVVDDAYIDVRNTLKELEASVSTDLSILLHDYARLIGLEIMQERAEEMNGKLTIQSTVRVGTQVTLWLPLILDLRKGQYA
jgi:signal transduction histidine kinase